MKAIAVHLKNKYPGARVDFDENRIDVYDQDNVHRIAIRKNGAGAVVDKGSEVGAIDEFCLSPIPKNARAWKLYASGKIALAEEGKDRLKAAHAMAQDGRVESIEVYKAHGIEFDAAGNLVFPKAAAQKAPEAPKAAAPVSSAPPAPSPSGGDSEASEGQAPAVVAGE